MAKKFPVKILYEKYHTRAGACQVGINNAEGDFVAFTDADCIPEITWLESLKREFEEGIVGVGGGIINIGEGIWERSINLISGTFLGSANSIQGRLFKRRRYVNSISGCNSMYKKCDILGVGGFEIGLSTAEDTALNRKMLRIGKLVYTPNAIVSHDHKRGLKKFAKRMYQYGYGRASAQLWDIQIVPPILVVLLFISLIFTLNIFLLMIGIYIIMIVAMASKFAISERNLAYLFSVPVAYITEHCSYTIGFWRGLLACIMRREVL